MGQFISTIVFLILLSILSLAPAYAMNDKQLETNKQLVTEFYNEVINNKDYEKAATYLGARYVQHNPVVADGPEGLKTFIDFLKNNFPNAHSEIKRIFADGDYVIVQIHSIRTPGTLGRVIFDLFKLENGKIVEHWDAIQDIPEKSVNNNGVF